MLRRSSRPALPPPPGADLSPESESASFLGFSLISMNREKRTAQLRINVPPSTREKVERLVAGSNVLSMSDYLYEVIEQHLDEVVRIQRKKIGVIGGQ